MCLLSLCAVSAGIDQCGNGDDHQWYSVAQRHHAGRVEAGVEDQDHHPEELDAFQTHPAEGGQVEVMEQTCHHGTAGLTGPRQREGRLRDTHGTQEAQN